MVVYLVVHYIVSGNLLVDFEVEMRAQSTAKQDR